MQKKLKYRAEKLKLWGCNEDKVPTSCTLPHRNETYQVSAVSSSTLQTQRPPIPSSSRAAEARGKRKMTSPSLQSLADLFNVQVKDEADDAIGKLFLANDIPFHVAHSPYYKDVVAKIIRAGASYAPLGETKLRTTILDQNYSKINI